MSNDTIGEQNYRVAARRAIQAYMEKGCTIDAIFWGHIIRHYEAEIETWEARFNSLKLGPRAPTRPGAQPIGAQPWPKSTSVERSAKELTKKARASASRTKR